MPLRAIKLSLAMLSGGLCTLLRGSSAGPNPGSTGAPFESSCTSCHSGGAGSGGVTIAFPGGLVYTVTVANTAQRQWGFQLTARWDTDNLSQGGQFTPGPDGYMQLSCLDKTYQLETFNNACMNNTRLPLPGTRNGTRGPVSFEFDWTPPGGNEGNVDFYFAANAANGDGGAACDYVGGERSFVRGLRRADGLSSRGPTFPLRAGAGRPPTS
jgi:hypothetical protein